MCWILINSALILLVFVLISWTASACSVLAVLVEILRQIWRTRIQTETEWHLKNTSQNKGNKTYFPNSCREVPLCEDRPSQTPRVPPRALAEPPQNPPRASQSPPQSSRRASAEPSQRRRSSAEGHYGPHVLSKRSKTVRGNLTAEISPEFNAGTLTAEI